MIGVFDSGFGGLSVLKELRRVLPNRDFLYLGDSGRAPYGGRDVNTILDFSEQAVERLFEEGCRLIIVACNTVSCVALRHLQLKYCGIGSDKRILGVTIPGAEIAVSTSRGHIGIIATKRTISSGTYEVELAKLGNLKVSTVAAPLLVGIVEEGWQEDPIALLTTKKYVSTFGDIDTLLLGCTHYPLLKHCFKEALPGVNILDPAPYLSVRLVDWLQRHPGFSQERSGKLRVLCTGDPEQFRRLGGVFLGEALPPVEHITEVEGRLAHRNVQDAHMGQYVRNKD